MAPISLIQDAVITTLHTEQEAFDCDVPSKTLAQKVSKVDFVLDVDDEQTTDMGESCTSDTESCSGLSCNEGNVNRAKRCRFGRTPLETIPATPSAGITSLGSPPGFSRAAMRQARDACKPESNPLATVESERNNVDSSNSAVASIPSTTLCRFGESSLGTVPKTPVSGAKWKALKKVVGSPPGLSHTEMRSSRDAFKVPAASWGGSQDLASTASSSGKRPSAQESLARMKQEAAKLKDLKRTSSQKSEPTTKQIPTSSVEANGDSLAKSYEANVQELSETDVATGMASARCSGKATGCHTFAGTGQQCRFDSTPLGTTPSTPVGGQVASPPGLSRKAMRLARDMCKANAASTPSWGAQAPLTINPSTTPLTQNRQMPR